MNDLALERKLRNQGVDLMDLRSSMAATGKTLQELVAIIMILKEKGLVNDEEIQSKINFIKEYRKKTPT